LAVSVWLILDKCFGIELATFAAGHRWLGLALTAGQLLAAIITGIIFALLIQFYCY